MTTSKVRKGNLGWAYHPRGGVVIDVVGDLHDMGAPYGQHRKLGPFGFPKTQVFHLDDLPHNSRIYSISSSVMEKLALTHTPESTVTVNSAWLKAKAR